ncbi:MAG: glycerophosphodiester phosphodiesterase [Actinomycetota bacterium]|nr:glycerophosphodiester phosphodiesterase [Actinomycetota bacterium]
MELLAHRGGRGFGIDNTLSAMVEAVRSGVRFIETDVRATEDGELVLCHDATIRGRFVKRMSYPELLKLAPDRPLLREVFEKLAGWVKFDLEIKDAPVREIGEMLLDYHIESETLVTSFDGTILAKLKEDFPSVRTGRLFRISLRDEKRLAEAKEIGADVLLPYFSSIDKEFVEAAHEFGMEVYVWTVNAKDDFIKLLDWEVDGVVTDNYLEFAEILEEREGHRGEEALAQVR